MALSVRILTGFDCGFICVSPDKLPFFNIHVIVFEKQSFLHITQFDCIQLVVKNVKP